MQTGFRGRVKNIRLSSKHFVTREKNCKFADVKYNSPMSNYGEKGRMELAMLYSPQLDPRAAWRKLKIWIEKCKPLAEELKQMGYTGHERIFTPKQVNRIVHYLGEY
jgi:hypothetical protein